MTLDTPACFGDIPDAYLSFEVDYEVTDGVPGGTDHVSFGTNFSEQTEPEGKQFTVARFLARSNQEFSMLAEVEGELIGDQVMLHFTVEYFTDICWAGPGGNHKESVTLSLDKLAMSGFTSSVDPTAADRATLGLDPGDGGRISVQLREFEPVDYEASTLNLVDYAGAHFTYADGAVASGRMWSRVGFRAARPSGS